jgi:Na+-driven multidrug efflux pump
MTTRFLMIASAITLCALGITLTFFPQELLNYFTQNYDSKFAPITLQLMGALYFAFAMVNWTAKGTLIGGIYGRPIAIGNLAHYAIGALGLLKGYSSEANSAFLLLTIYYVVFAILFGFIFTKNPVKKEA